MTITSQQAYEAGVAVLTMRARRVLAQQENALMLFAGSMDRWCRPVPWLELSDFEREFWDIIAGLVNDQNLSIKQIGSVLDVVHASAAKDHQKRKELLEKCGKGWPQ